jgi:hypothetical protein
MSLRSIFEAACQYQMKEKSFQRCQIPIAWLYLSCNHDVHGYDPSPKEPNMNRLIHSDELQNSLPLKSVDNGRAVREDTERFLSRGLTLIRDPNESLARLLMDLAYDCHEDVHA